MNIHIGSKIRHIMEMQHKTVTWLSHEYGCSRVNMYKIFSKPSIDTSMLFRLSKILNHNFFSYYSTEFDKRTQNEQNEH